MKALLLSGALIMVVPQLLPAENKASETDGAVTLASKISEVTVYADRARVVRTVAAALPAETGRFAFRKLPGWIDEGSIRLSITPEGAADLLDVQVISTFLARPDDEAILKAEQAVLEISDQVAALEDQRAVLEAEGRQIEAIRAFSLEKLPKDTAMREVKVEEYEGVVKFIGRSMLEVTRARRDLEKKQRELQPEAQVRQKSLNELRQRSQLEQRTVVVTVRGKGAPATLALTYMLPGAAWEPAHELRSGGTGMVAIASFGLVTQTTGEDWEDAAVLLSTQRSEETIRLPELEALLVDGQRPLPRMQTSSIDSYKTANDKFEGQWTLWNGYVNAAPLQAEMGRNWAEQKARQRRAVEVFASIQQQRGTTEHFEAAGRQTIRADGRPVRLPIGSLELKAKTRLTAAPELSLNAVRTAELINTGKLPLLPGKVQLYVGGAFLGTTDVDFVAPGESFPVFLGVADTIKLSRSLDKKRSSVSWSGRRTRMQVSFLVTAENLSDQPTAIELADRVPVSQTDDIKVLGVRLIPAAKPDAQGLLKWEVALGAREAKEFRIEYGLDYPAELPRLNRVRPADGDASQPAPNDSGLQDQIMNLEKALK